MASLDQDEFVKKVPKAPGKWICLRVQEAHFGPFFQWADASVVTAEELRCIHCRGDCELEVSSHTGATTEVECPWCEGTGKSLDESDIAKQISDGHRPANTVWCDTNGNVLEADLDAFGWISWHFLQQYEPRIAA